MNIDPKIIKTDAEYRLYRSEVEQLAAEDPPRGSPEGDRLELLARLVDEYEAERFVFEKPDRSDTNDLFADLRRELASRTFDSMEDLQDFADTFMEHRNRAAWDDFHGFSPEQMSALRTR